MAKKNFIVRVFNWVDEELKYIEEGFANQPKAMAFLEEIIAKHVYHKIRVLNKKGECIHQHNGHGNHDPHPYG